MALSSTAEDTMNFIVVRCVEIFDVDDRFDSESKL
jgi:hypothetical protein